MTQETSIASASTPKRKAVIEWAVFIAMAIFAVVVARYILPSYIDHRIENYIANNPARISELGKHALSTHPIKAEDEKNLIEKYKSELLSGISIKHSANKTNYIIIFSDYSCGYCKIAEKTMAEKFRNKISGKNLVFHELPILPGDSNKIARLAIAANELGLYERFRTAILPIARPTEADALKIFEQLGVDRSMILSMSSSKTVDEHLARSKSLAEKLKITGTPAIVLNGAVMRGWNEDAFANGL